MNTSRPFTYLFLLSLVAFSGFNLSCEQETPATFYTIGQEANGGIIFYLDSTKRRGMVVAKNGWNGTTDDPAVEWGCSGINITGADGINIGTGSQNTADIITAGCASANNAARKCADLTYNGYSDWYLPSLEELKLILEFNDGVSFIGIKPSVLYFTSSENGVDANTVSSDSPYGEENTDKTEAHYIRPIRSF
jgi:hypothetical protein